MKEEIDHAIQLILDRPEEAKLIHWALKLDDDVRAAFLFAWVSVNADKE